MFVRKDQRCLLFENGDYIKCLKPGKQRISPFKQYNYKWLDLSSPFNPGMNLSLFMEDEELLSELDLVDVSINQLSTEIILQNSVKGLTEGLIAIFKIAQSRLESTFLWNGIYYSSHYDRLVTDETGKSSDNDWPKGKYGAASFHQLARPVVCQNVRQCHTAASGADCYF